MSELNRLAQYINNANDIILITHINPDGDAAGATLALYLCLKNMGKNVFCVCDGKLPAKYSFMNELAQFCDPETNFNMVIDLAVAVDCADISRLSKCRHYFESARQTANIDHHITNPHFADINIVKKSSSSGEIIFEVIKELKQAFTPEICLLLYVAISTDTGNFIYSNTTPEALHIMAHIIEKYNHAEIARLLYSTRTKDDTYLIGKIIENMKFYNGDRVCYSNLTLKELSVLGEMPDFERAITYLCDIDTVVIAIFIRQLDHNSYKVSLRSKGDVDVSAVAEKFGGGGHKNASGCKIDLPLNECFELVYKEAEKLL